jgi:hypothetical protein
MKLQSSKQAKQNEKKKLSSSTEELITNSFTAKIIAGLSKIIITVHHKLK